MKKVYLIYILFATMFFSCNERPDSPKHSKNTLSSYFDLQEEGIKSGGVKMIPIKTSVGTFKVWTKRFGNNPRIKILILHGGPALTHEYLESFESYFPGEGFEFYEYDQLGSYYSDQPKDSVLWTLDRFTDEVEQVRKALGLTKDNFFLLGQSWGGILAMEYALKYQQNVKGLIISNMMASYPKYGAYNEKLRQELRKSLVDSLVAFEQKGDFHNPVYQQLVTTEFYCKHICRMPEAQWPEPIQRSFKHINQPVYELIQGPSEFVPGGLLKNWDREHDLKKITVPTLMIGAHYDSMDPEYMKLMSTLVPNGEYLYCPDGSHLCMWDDQQHYFPGVINFINKVDQSKK